MSPENKVYRLPDYYNKKTGSNNWKILELQRQGVDILDKEIELVRNASDVSKATGAGLDVWGDINDIKRNGLADEEYRIQILIQMARDMIDPDFTTWYSTVLDTFQCTSDDIVVSETGNPFEYRFDKFPLSAVQKIGLDINAATSLIEGILPITGQLLEILYDGGVPVDITEKIGTILGASSSATMTNDYRADEGIYISPYIHVTSTGEVSEQSEGNHGRNKTHSMTYEDLSAATAIGTNSACVLQDVLIAERELDAQSINTAAIIDVSTKWGMEG